jgi:archaellum component FlaF (FlaF/FlaG flagellin family)
VSVGSSLQRNVRITNIGDESIIIRSFDIVSNVNVFKVPNAERMVMVRPDNSYDITVQFSPTEPVNYTGNIVFTYDGGMVQLYHSLEKAYKQSL